jgi:sugar phosphate isomerase/epimerase
MFLSIRDAQTRHAQADGLVSSHAATLRVLGISSVEVWLDPDNTLRFWQREENSSWHIESTGDAQRFSQVLGEHGISIAALCLPTDFAAHPEHVEWATRSVLLAHAMGARAVRIDTATSAHEMSKEEVRNAFCTGIEKVLKSSAEAPLPLGIENHGHISNDVAFLDAIFARVGDDRLGMTLDPGNFYWFGLPLEEVYAVCEHFAPRTCHTHFKNIAFPPETQNETREPGWKYGEFVSPLARGDLDMARLVGILKRAGYEGDLCVEDESLGHFEAGERTQVLEEDAECLRVAVASASTST